MWLGDAPLRGDKLMDATEVATWLEKPATVEEKVDGANLGLSLAADGRLRAQSRGQYLSPHAGGQWKPLWRWLAERERHLRAALDRYSVIVFGEWCYAEHSVHYDALPDWFLLFDVYGLQEGRFWSRRRRDELARVAGLSTVPVLATGQFSPPTLRKLLGSSRLGSVPAEGIYLRWDDQDWLLARAKMVRPGWLMASDEHWMSRPLQTNQLSATATLQDRS
jgi:ATP-dependent RNA circularization protein (DNA/RNA ligase family)